MHASYHRSKGFTLIELLVVLAALAVSAVTLVAALNQTGGRGRTLQCLGNMRCLALASQMYVSDHDGYLPNGQAGSGMFLAGRLAPYLGVAFDKGREWDAAYAAALFRTVPVFRCPSWPNAKMQVDYGLQYTCNNIDYSRLGPVYSTYFPVGPDGLKLSAVPFPPSDIAFVLEVYGDPGGSLELSYSQLDVHNGKQTTFNQIGTPNAPGEVRMIWAGDRRHDVYTTLSFMDSRVEVRALTKEELPWRIFNTKDANNIY